MVFRYIVCRRRRRGRLRVEECRRQRPPRGKTVVLLRFTRCLLNGFDIRVSASPDEDPEDHRWHVRITVRLRNRRPTIAIYATRCDFLKSFLFTLL